VLTAAGIVTHHGTADKAGSRELTPGSEGELVSSLTTETSHEHLAHPVFLMGEDLAVREHLLVRQLPSAVHCSERWHRAGCKRSQAGGNLRRLKTALV
jgi:hypothetical protein